MCYHCGNIDLFTATKLNFCLCKILGTISYSVHGYPKLRKIQVHKKDIVYPFVSIFIFVICTVFMIFEIIKIELTFFFKIAVFVLIYNFMALPFYLLFSLVNRNSMCDIWRRLDKFCSELEYIGFSINYNCIKTQCDTVVIFLYVFLLLCTADDYLLLNYGNQIWERFFITAHFYMFSMLTTCVESQMIVLLIIIKYFIRKLNNAILYNSCFRSENMNLHFELFDICRNIDKIFYVNIFRIFIGFFCLSYSIFGFTVQQDDELYLIYKMSVWYCLAFFLWGLFNITGIVVILTLCQIIKEEVSFEILWLFYV